MPNTDSSHNTSVATPERGAGPTPEALDRLIDNITHKDGFIRGDAKETLRAFARSRAEAAIEKERERCIEIVRVGITTTDMMRSIKYPR